MSDFVQRLRNRLQSGPNAPVGSWLMSCSPLVAEAMGHAGFDWAVVDMEHSQLDTMELISMLQAVGNTGMHPVVRVTVNDTGLIKRALDVGATTLMVPMVQNVEEARAAVAATRYPPQGVRGVAGMSRASKYATVPNYLTTANEGIRVIVQLETPEAIAQLEKMAAVEGVDAFFIGPADLSATMGHLGQPAHPEVLKLTEEAVRRIHACGKVVGTIGGDLTNARRYQAMGFDFVAISTDLSYVVRGAQAAIAGMRERHA